ncbi:MAG: alpha/beta hydrolase, partial [bacterium]
YVSYLDTLYNEVFKRVNRSAVKVFVLGFSQGVATVCRWLRQGRAKADQLILWAGTMPPELDAGVMRNMIQQRPLTLVTGKQDEFADPDRLIEEEKRLKEREIPYRLILFEGGHQIDSEVLKELANS